MISSPEGADELDPAYVEYDRRDSSNGVGWLLAIDLVLVSDGTWYNTH